MFHYFLELIDIIHGDYHSGNEHDDTYWFYLAELIVCVVNMQVAMQQASGNYLKEVKRSDFVSSDKVMRGLTKGR